MLPPYYDSLPLDLAGAPSDGWELFWSREDNLSDQISPDSALEPYIVLMESTMVERNLGKYDDLKLAGYKLFILTSLIKKKALIREIDLHYSPWEAEEPLDRSSRKIVIPVRRRINRDGSFTNTVEFTLAIQKIPRFVYLRGFEHALSLVIPAPRRWYNCQRLGHVSD